MEFRNCDGRNLVRKIRYLRETDVWSCGPSPWGILVYSVVIPTISALGIAGNVLILLVLGGKSLKASTYTYLAVLAGADLITCILLLLSGLRKEFFGAGVVGSSTFAGLLDVVKRRCTGDGLRYPRPTDSRFRERARLTVTLVGIVFVFLVGELPTHLASKKSAVSILYGGDPTKVHEVFMERFRIWTTVLNAISSSAGFVLYCLLSPQFLTHLEDLVTVVRDGPRKNNLKNCNQPSTIQRLASKEGIDF